MALRPRLVVASAALAVIAAALLLAVRADSAISFLRPLLVVTSGAEEEGVLGVLRAMDGAAYVDPSRIPFAASYYNWLFFAFFGGIIGAVKTALSLDVAWVPTIGRFVGLAGAVACGLLGAGVIARVAPGPTAVGRHNRLLAVWLAIGPLVGWWALSINPELWATALTEAAVLAVLAGYGRRPLAAVALAGVLAAAAWGFKQSYVFAPLALGLFLLIRRDWRALAMLTVVMAAGVMLPLWLGSPDYRAMLLAFKESEFAVWQFWRNLTNSAPKVMPILVAAAFALPALRDWRRMIADQPLLLALCGVLACLPVLPASIKVGAAENYYFPLVFFLGLLAARGVARVDGAGWPLLPSLILASAWLASAVACVVVLAGVAGVAGVGDMDGRYRAQRDCVAGLPAPMYSIDPYLQLPWMHGPGPRFVLAYQYLMERARGRVFERGGIGGLVAEGYFAALVLPRGTAPVVDGTALGPDYLLAHPDCAGLAIYLRR